MAADPGATQTFKDGRSSLRETAKWLVSGIATAATLTVGTAAFSQLGALAIGWRFGVAVLALATAAFFWWKPFKAAVQVLKSEMLALPDFIKAQARSEAERTDEDSARARALEAANAKLNGFLPFASIGALVAECDRLRTVVFAEQRSANPPAAKSKSREQLDGLAPLELFSLETCTSALVADRFDTLVDSLWRFGGMSLIGFAVFAWAANPPKDTPQLLDAPADLTAALGRYSPALAASGLDPACFAAGASLITVAGSDAGPKTALLIPPHPTPKGCKAQKLTLSPDDRFISLN